MILIQLIIPLASGCDLDLTGYIDPKVVIVAQGSNANWVHVEMTPIENLCGYTWTPTNFTPDVNNNLV